MNLYLSLVVVMAFLMTAASQAVPPPAFAPAAVPTSSFWTGGWSTQDPKNIEVRKAARYAVSVSYPTGTISAKVVTAKSQVVSGYTYDLNVAVTFVGNKSCSMQNYVVWKVGDPKAPSPYKLVSKRALTSQLCPSK